MSELPDPLPSLRLKSSASTVYGWLIRDTGPDADVDILDAPYQRQSVWDTERQRNLIRSLFMGIPVGAITYSAVPYGTIPEVPTAYRRIIDGKQRLEAIRAFANNEFTIPGWWLHPEDGADEDLRSRDVTYSDLPAPIRRDFESAHIPTQEFDSFVEWIPNPEFDRDVKFGEDNNYDKHDPRLKKYIQVDLDNDAALRREADVYLLINFGGVEQTDEDRARAAEVAR